MKTTYYFLGFVLLTQVITGQTKNFIDQPYLETIAKVDTLVSPDIIYLDILIREKDERNKISVEEMEFKMIQELKSLGINIEEQLILTDLASNFKNYFLKQKDVMKDKAYELKIFDTQTAGKVIVRLEEVGIANVSLNRTAYSKMETLKLQLKSKAVTKAKMQADFLVTPLNQKVVRALHITDKHHESYNNISGQLDEVVVVGYSSRGKQDYIPPSIAFKPISVLCEVIIKFAIE